MEYLPQPWSLYYMQLSLSMTSHVIKCFEVEKPESMVYILESTVLGILPSFGPVSCSEWSLTGCLKASEIMSYIGVGICMGV